MDFVTFFDILYRVISGKSTKADFCRDLFLAICPPDSDVADKLMDYVATTYRHYVTNNNISSIALEIIPYIDKDYFKKFIEKSGYEAQKLLVKEFQKYYPDATYENIIDLCADCFVKIINDSANKKIRAGSFTDNSFVPLEDTLALHAEGMVCPLCGDELIKKKNGKLVGSYKKIIAFPLTDNHDNNEKITYYKNMVSDSCQGNTTVILCKDCAQEYEKNFMLDDLKKIVAFFKAKQDEKVLTDIRKRAEIDQDIVSIIDELAKYDEGRVEENTKKNLNMYALKISSKIRKENLLLRSAIERNVMLYYRFIEQQFKQLDKTKSRSFMKFAHKIQGIYLNLADTEESQDAIFGKIVEWLMSISGNENHIACSIIASFFVQNCEVFDEVSE